MPMTKGDHQTPTTIFSDVSVTLPNNLEGDHCNQGGTQFFCGYWFSNGWSDSNQNNYPDPEDWGESDDSTSTWISCMFR